MDLSSILGSTGMNPLDMAEGLMKLQAFLPKIKSLLPKAKEFEKTLNLKQNQLVTYTVTPNANSTEIIFSMLVLEKQEDGTTKVVKTLNGTKVFEMLEKISVIIPTI